MQCYIKGRIVEAKLIERGSSTAPGCSTNRFPLLVECEGQQVIVYDNEGDARCIPGDRGPVRRGRYTISR
jgi:hypothetical protein